MPQLNFYVSKEVADELRRRAKEKKLPVSKYIAGIVTKDIHPSWPPGFLESTFGSIPDLERPTQLPVEPVEPW